MYLRRHPCHPPRAALLGCALSAVLALGARAHASEIAPPAPLAEDIEAGDGRTTLARWLGQDPPAAERLVTTSDPRRNSTQGAMIVGFEGGIGLTLPSHHASGLPPRALRAPESTDRHGLYEIVRGADSPRWQRASLASSSTSERGGATRLDVRPEDRNPIALRTSVLEELTARVVRTPEPGTLALFTLGLLGLAGVIAGRKRSSRP